MVVVIAHAYDGFVMIWRNTADLCLLGWLFSLLWKEQVEERYIMDRNQYNYKSFYIFRISAFFSACNIDFIQSIIFHSLTTIHRKKNIENYSEGIYDWCLYFMQIIITMILLLRPIVVDPSIELLISIVYYFRI